jgi:hypothetical protein
MKRNSLNKEAENDEQIKKKIDYLEAKLDKRHN